MVAPIQPQIEQIFIEAEALQPEERTAFLQRVCAGDDDAREEVETLLKAAAVCEEYFGELSERVAATVCSLMKPRRV